MSGFDMLVKLYDLPEVYEPDGRVRENGIRVCRPLPADRSAVTAWVRKNFSDIWANETEKAMAHTPTACFIALDGERNIAGFACYDASAPDFFGPIGVGEEYRGLHIGRELLRRCLYAMREEGYGYAVIGWVEDHNEAFYAKNCGAVRIPDSFPGIYRDILSGTGE